MHVTQLENAAFLLGKGVDIQAADASGDTALHWSANKGDPELSRMLLAAGANPHALDAYKQSPLHLAVIGGNAGLVRTLVELVCRRQQELVFFSLSVYLVLKFGLCLSSANLFYFRSRTFHVSSD